MPGPYIGAFHFAHGKSPGADDQSAPGFFRKEKRGKKMKMVSEKSGAELGSLDFSMYRITENGRKINKNFIKIV